MHLIASDWRTRPSLVGCAEHPIVVGLMFPKSIETTLTRAIEILLFKYARTLKLCFVGVSYMLYVHLFSFLKVLFLIFFRKKKLTVRVDIHLYVNWYIHKYEYGYGLIIHEIPPQNLM